jgi:hypothetical protein
MDDRAESSLGARLGKVAFQNPAKKMATTDIELRPLGGSVFEPETGRIPV